MSFASTSRVLAIASLLIAAALSPACGDPCEGDARCIQGECIPIAHEDDPCFEGSCADGLWCAPPLLRCAPTLTLGPACDPASHGDTCGEGWCDPLLRRCLPLPRVGDDCTIDGRCAGGGFCFNGVCESLPGDREPCVISTKLRCALGLMCVNEVCTRPTVDLCHSNPVSTQIR